MSFSAYSDEIAQASHLFPFYPLPHGKGTDCLFSFLQYTPAPPPLSRKSAKEAAPALARLHPVQNDGMMLP